MGAFVVVTQVLFYGGLCLFREQSRLTALAAAPLDQPPYSYQVPQPPGCSQSVHKQSRGTDSGPLLLAFSN